MPQESNEAESLRVSLQWKSGAGDCAGFPTGRVGRVGERRLPGRSVEYSEAQVGEETEHYVQILRAPDVGSFIWQKIKKAYKMCMTHSKCLINVSYYWHHNVAWILVKPARLRAKLQKDSRHQPP